MPGLSEVQSPLLNKRIANVSWVLDTEQSQASTSQCGEELEWEGMIL